MCHTHLLWFETFFFINWLATSLKAVASKALTGCMTRKEFALFNFSVNDQAWVHLAHPSAFWICLGAYSPLDHQPLSLPVSSLVESNRAFAKIFAGVPKPRSCLVGSNYEIWVPACCESSKKTFHKIWAGNLVTYALSRWLNWRLIDCLWCWVLFLFSYLLSLLPAAMQHWHRS